MLLHAAVIHSDPSLLLKLKTICNLCDSSTYDSSLIPKTSLDKKEMQDLTFVSIMRFLVAKEKMNGG